MKKVPFYPNDSDSANRCMLAVYGSIIEYFTGKKSTWDDLKKFTGYKKKPVWSLKALVNAIDLGLKVKMIEPFDYKAYQKDGLKYFKSFFTPQEYEWQVNNAETLDIKLLPMFFKKVDWEFRSAQLSDIDQMLNDNMVVIVGINSRVINHKDGYSSHAVLVIDKVENEYIIHDPGLPPIAYRHVEGNLLLKAMGGKNHNNEVTGFGRQL